MAQTIDPMQFIVSIVERGEGAHMIEYYQAHGISQHFRTSGRGTAASHTLDTLGFGTAERDVIISCGQQDTVRQLMHQLKDDDRPKLGVKGIAFSLRISGMSAILAVCVSRLEETYEKGDTQVMGQNNNHSLILVAVNQGYTDAVMDTAKTAGAKGGTVIRARWIGADEVQKHSGISLQSEKEILAILAKNEDRNAIMEEIERVHSLRSAAQGTLVSIPVDYTSKID